MNLNLCCSCKKSPLQSHQVINAAPFADDLGKIRSHSIRRGRFAPVRTRLASTSPRTYPRRRRQQRSIQIRRFPIPLMQVNCRYIHRNRRPDSIIKTWITLFHPRLHLQMPVVLPSRSSLTFRSFHLVIRLRCHMKNPPHNLHLHTYFQSIPIPLILVRHQSLDILLFLSRFEFCFFLVDDDVFVLFAFKLVKAK